MSWDSVLSDERELLALVGALRDGSARTAAFKILYAKTVLGSAVAGAPVSSSNIQELLFDLSHGLSLRRAREVLLGAGLVRASEIAESGMEVPATIALRDIYPDDDEAADIEIPAGRFLELMELDRSQHQRTQPPAGVAECVAVLNATSRWGAAIAGKVLAADLPGVPVFWDCRDDDHTPFAMDPGTLTTTDTVLLMLERVRRGMPAPPLDLHDRAVCLGLVTKLLDLQRSDDGWNCGGFNVPAWDDDFLGSFDKDHPELGPCPTVDATGGAVMALCAALACATTNIGADFNTRASVAVERGVDFLLRSQSVEGGWPVFRYEGDVYALPARHISSRYAVEALADAVRGQRLCTELAARAREAALRYVNHAITTARCGEAECAWLPNFTKADAGDRDQIQATSTIWLTLEAVVHTWQEFEPLISPLRRKAIAFVERAWEPDPTPNGFVSIEFRVPRWTGPGDTFTYEWPADPVAVSMLLTASRKGNFMLRTETSERIGRAISSFLALQKHGHWDDFLMARRGENRAVPPNTIQYHRALLDYLQWQAEVLRRFFDGTCDGFADGEVGRCAPHSSQLGARA